MHKAKKIRVKKGDIYRILHSELLPYEVPIVFSNRRLYSYYRDPDAISKTPAFVRDLLNDNRNYSIPFSFHIWQGSSNLRVLGLIHPAWQRRFVEFYRDYHQVILSLCGKSTYSIRYPSKVSSYFYERDYAVEADGLITDAAEEEAGRYGREATHASTYFAYARYSQLYRFIDSPEFLGLELRYSHLLRFDIKRCFASIYTHSLSWAVKGKPYAKANRTEKGFDGAFDALMQGVNFQETNGIVIGPEVSRIFAEVILQQIDLDIAEQLSRTGGINDGDFAIRRYVDDYFVFAKTEVVCKRIYLIAQERLLKYKLYVNEAKTEWHRIPYATPQTTAKVDVQQVLQGTVLSWLGYLTGAALGAKSVRLEKAALRRLGEPEACAAILARDIKIAVNRSGVTFEVVTSNALGSIAQALYRVQRATRGKRLEKTLKQESRDILLVTVDLAFYLYAMDFRVRTTYFVAQIMLLVMRIARSDELLSRVLNARIWAQIVGVVSNRPRDERAGVEIHNLLIALRSIAPTMRLDVSTLRRLFGVQLVGVGQPTEDNQGFNYFDVIALLYYMGDAKEYEEVRVEVLDNVMQRLRRSDAISRDSELVHLIVDVLACPFVEVDKKRALVTVVFQMIKRRAPKSDEIGEVINYVTKYLGFTDWDAAPGLERMLTKKRLNPAY